MYNKKTLDVRLSIRDIFRRAYAHNRRLSHHRKRRRLYCGKGDLSHLFGVEDIEFYNHI